MSGIGSRDTLPELTVRSFLHAAGLRFRLHRRDLPGTPDIVLPRLRTVVFVHGCFWHRHSGCRRCSIPATRQDFWARKFAANVRRDAAVEEALVAANWKVLVVWECRTRKLETLEQDLMPLVVASRKQRLQ